MSAILPCALLASGVAAVCSLAAPSAHADELPAPGRAAPAEADTRPARSTRPYQFRGVAFYGGGGLGVLDVGSLTESFRAVAAAQFSRWLAFEGFGLGYHFVGEGHHGREDATALGIGFGVRASPTPVDSVIRPYAALRFEHVHLWPDFWGPHDHDETGDSHDHTSVHRWGGAFAAGLDAPLDPESPRWRVGFDAEAALISGPGTNFGLNGLFLVGCGL